MLIILAIVVVMHAQINQYMDQEDKENLESETNIDQKFILILLIFIINYIFKKNVIITISSYS